MELTKPEKYINFSEREGFGHISMFLSFFLIFMNHLLETSSKLILFMVY